jgi:4Fe-4S single cluster domain of Ferredoxin I
MSANTDDRFPKNVPGPFYVANEQCLACGTPEQEAPDLMESDEQTGHCYFKKQPTTPEELERAVQAVQVSCCGAVLYSGNDPAILRRLKELRKEARHRRQKTRWELWKKWLSGPTQ